MDSFPFKLGKVGQIEFWQQKNSVIMLFHNVQCFLEFMISHSKECIKAKKMEFEVTSVQ